MALLSGDKKKDAAALLVVAEGHIVDDEPKEAKEAAEKAMGLSTEVKDTAGVADAMRMLVLAQVAGSEVEAGLAKAKEELAKYKKGSDKHGEGVMLLAMSEAEVMAQELEEGLAHAKEAAAAFKAKGEKSWQAKASLSVANAQLQLDNYKEAVNAVKEAKSLFQEAGDKCGEGSTHEQLAVVELSRDMNAEVVNALLLAAKIYREAGAKRELGVALASMAEFYLAKNKRGEAIKTAKEAWEVSKEAKHGQGVANAMALVARAYVVTGSVDEAVDKMRDEAAECKKAGDAKGEAAALSALFQAMLAADDAEGALCAARRALGALTKVRDSKGIARMQHSIAALEYERGYWDTAIKAAKEALTALAEAGGSLKEATALETIMANAYDARGEEPPSSALREKALKVLKDLGKALEEQNVEAFEGALKRLGRQSAVTYKDTDRAFAPALEKNPEKSEEFLAIHMGDYQKGGPPELPYLEREPDLALRMFPAKAGCEAGRTDEGGEWSQTAGRIILWHQLSNGPHDDVPGGWRQEDMVVEMSCAGLKVTLGGGKPFKPLTGDFTERVFRKYSWWILDEETGIFELHLYKRTPATWKSPWWAYDNIEGVTGAKFKRVQFPWTKPMELQKGPPLWEGFGEPISGLKQTMEEIKAEEKMDVKLPGKQRDPEDGPSYQRSSFAEVFQEPGENFVCSADEICLGLTATQDEHTVRIQVHFEKFRWEDLKRRMPVEHIFGLDVWEKEICVFLQGDKQNPILWGELAGFCIPHETEWRLVSAEVLRSRQLTLGSYTPCLEIVLTRAESHKWDQVFSTCVQHRLLPKDMGDRSEGAERFEGLKDCPHLRRSGFNVEGADFWSYVGDYVNDTIKRTGHSSLPKKLTLA